MQLNIYIRHHLDYLVNLEKNNLKKRRDTLEETLEENKKY